jgi:NAD-dependent deacetylase
VSSPASIVILTGAGISAESGTATFRDAGGVWAQYDYRDVATPEGFARNPKLVHEFYNLRRKLAQEVKPNAAHHALAQLERDYTGRVTIVTQNVDNLHEAAGSRSLIHMHGELMRVFCMHCDVRRDWLDALSIETVCPHCSRSGAMRPDVVWFGEMPYHMDEIGDHLDTCDLFVSIGTSGSVYPAAGFVARARQIGARTVELNLEPSEGARHFDEAVHGKATDIVPAFVARVLSGAR